MFKTLSSVVAVEQPSQLFILGDVFHVGQDPDSPFFKKSLQRFIDIGVPHVFIIGGK